jgi:hypothetical protein
MSLSTTYTKVETDFLLQQIDKKVVGGYKGDLRISDSAPTEKGYYMLLETGIYTNLGGINATTGKLNFASFDGTSWSLVSVETSINTKINSVEKLSALNTGKGLPMVLQSSVLTNLTSVNGGDIITPQMFNNFLWDFKLKGTPESGFTYIVGTIQYNSIPNAPYENYLSIQKVSNAGIKTVIGNLYLPSTLQRGVGTYNFTLTTDSATVTQATIVLNWEALLGNVGGSYSSIYDKGYRFDNDYLFNPNTGYLAEKAKLDSISTDTTKALSRTTTTETTTWQLANDSFAGEYGFKNIAQYTKRMSIATAFSQVNLQKVAYEGTVTYKVYIVNELATRNSRDTPTGVISGTTHTLLKEGTIAMTEIKTDYKISLGDVFICPVGSQVVVYMSATNTIQISGTSGGAGTADSNPALFSATTTPFSDGSWSSGSFNNTTSTGYFNLALKLVNAPLFEVAGANDVIVVKAKLDSISTDTTKALSRTTTTETTTWQLANDSFAGEYGFKNIAQYTKRMSVATSFSQVNLQKVAYEGTVTYKVYIVNELATRNSRDTPTGVISGTTHTLLKEGTIAMTEIKTDYKISLGDVFICPVGSQVVVYMSATNTIQISGTSGGAGTADSNPALFSATTTPFSGGSWSSGSFNNTTSTGYFNLALKLVNAPLFEVAGANDVIVENYLKLTIPNKVYALVGTEINLYNDAISYSIDRGLVSPLNYQTKWTCAYL